MYSMWKRQIVLGYATDASYRGTKDIPDSPSKVISLSYLFGMG